MLNVVTMIDLFTLKRNPSNFYRTKFSTHQDSYDFVKNLYEDDLDIFESLYIVLFDKANYTIGYAKISQGGIAATIVDVKLIALYAVKSLASSVLLIHNHPSGSLIPSQADKQITLKIVEALKYLDVTVADHLIVSTEGYYSFDKNGEL